MKLGPSKHDLHRTICILLVSLFVFMLSGFFLPEHVAHAQDRDFEYILTDGKAVITAYKGSGGAVAIPSQLEGHAVTAIAKQAFADNAAITELTLADSITTIDEEAFKGTALKSLVIPGGVTGIGDQAFAQCKELQKVWFYGDAPQMGSDVFLNTGSAFLVYFFADNAGWSQPQWQGYPCAPIPAALPLAYIISADVIGTSSIKVTWEAVPEATEYELFGALSPAGEYSLISTMGTTSFTHPALNANTVYSYKVRACFDAGVQKIYGAFSAEIRARTGIAAPVLSVSSSNFNSNSLYWNVVPGAQGYEIYRSVSPQGIYAMISDITDGTQSGYYDTGLSAGSAYYYQIRAYAHADGTKVFSEYSAVGAETVLPAAPALSAVSAGYQSIRLSWNKVEGANGYELFRAASFAGTYKKIKTTGAGALTCSRLKTGTPYFFKVRSYRTVNKKKVYSDFSPVMSAAPQLPYPALVSATPSGHNSARISWKSVSPASGYEIFRATSPDGPYTRIHTARSRRTVSLTDKNLVTGMTYYYQVRSFRKVGAAVAYSDFSPAKSAQPLPAKTTGINFERPAQTSVRMTWAGTPGATGYEVFEAASNQGAYNLIASTVSSSYEKSGLDPEQTYFYKIRAFSSIGDEKAYGAYSDAVPALMPLADINREQKKYGRMTAAGMKPDDYHKAVAAKRSLVNIAGMPINHVIDLENQMDYSALEEYMLNLGKHNGVEVYSIGQSEQGRNIYMVKLALGENEQDKPLIMITGGVHAREFAGTDYAIKFLNDTLIKAQADPYTRWLLEQVVIVAVPLVNPDGREMVINGGNASRKSNARGVDLNRNMPSINAGQHAKGVKRTSHFSSKPGMAYFAGYSLGSESETRALIKWFDHYVPKANVYIDLHQQGGMTFYNKRFVTERIDALSKDHAQKTNALLQNGYPLRAEPSVYGLNGSGGSFTDYAESVSEGFVYSFKYGRMVLMIDGKETPLLCFKDIDKQIMHYKPVNERFKSVTIEIGRSQSTGAGAAARQRRKNEYEKYGWEGFLTGTIRIVLGID